MNTVNLVNQKLWEEKASELYIVMQQVKELEEKKSILMKDLKYLSNNQTYFSFPYLFEKSFAKGSVNYAVIPQLIGVDLDSYRKSDTERWSLKKIEL